MYKAVNNVAIVPMFSDNYGYILIDKATNSAALVDPADPSPVKAACEALKVDVKMILNTHKHADHTGGNLDIASSYAGIEIVGPSKDGPIPGLTQKVDAGVEFNLGSTKIKVLETPCHTSGHISYVAEATDDTSIPSVLFPGDTLFVGGCGRFFEGTAAQMLNNMDQYRELSGDTLVCCAHEYTEANFKYLASVDPELIQTKYQEVRDKRANGEFTVPSTIGEEMKWNLFMKCRESRVQDLMGSDNPEIVMKLLREGKNNFKG